MVFQANTGSVNLMHTKCPFDVIEKRVHVQDDKDYFGNRILNEVKLDLRDFSGA